MNSDKKIRILFRGWFNIPHSYSMVNIFQIVNLYKRHGNQIDFYIEEMPYYRQEWYSSKKLVYSQEYNDIIRSFKQWNGEEIDLVYSITYPYNMDMVTVNGKVVPKCVFYTSEFATLEPTYFSCTSTNLSQDHFIKEYVSKTDKLYMTSPSIWSSLGMKKYGLADDKNRVITHGVDPDVFRYNTMNRGNVRDFYKVKDDDILMINIGSMTRNKGMVYIIQMLNILVNRLNKGYYKLLLKGTGDLYNSKTFLEIYFNELLSLNAITRDEMNVLLEKNIIFTDKTLSYEKINDLFNAADLYVSPYFAEGFNLTSLEALTSGLPVMIPETGSTREYIRDIYENGGDKHVMYIKSKVVRNKDNHCQNSIDFKDFLDLFLERENDIRNLQKLRNSGELSYDKMRNFIKDNYSWGRVSDLLLDYFRYILKR